MAIRYYDEAVSAKISSWLPKRNGKPIRVLKPDETNRLYSIEASEARKENLTLPMIALSRDTTIEIMQPTMTPKSMNGLLLDATQSAKLNLNDVPIAINYQLDIYTARYDEGDDLLREFIIKLMHNNQVVVEFPYNDQKFKHVSTITLNPQVEDTSNISEKLFPDQFTRWSIRFSINDAHLFSLPYTSNPSIENVSLSVADNKVAPHEFTEE